MAASLTALVPALTDQVVRALDPVTSRLTEQVLGRIQVHITLRFSLRDEGAAND